MPSPPSDVLSDDKIVERLKRTASISRGERLPNIAKHYGFPPRCSAAGKKRIAAGATP